MQEINSHEWVQVDELCRDALPQRAVYLEFGGFTGGTVACTICPVLLRVHSRTSKLDSRDDLRWNVYENMFCPHCNTSEYLSREIHPEEFILFFLLIRSLVL